MSKFYSPDLYKLGAGDAELSSKSIDYYVTTIGKRPKRILDVGAGYGRVAFPLLEVGHSITCIENNAPMYRDLCLSIRELTSEEKDRIQIFYTDMACIDYEELFDYVVAVDDVLLHVLDTNLLQHVFDQIFLSLKKGGVFLTDIRERNIEEMKRRCNEKHLCEPIVITDNPINYLLSTYWEEFCPNTRSLNIFRRDQVLDISDQVIRDTTSVLSQVLHRTNDILQIARNSGFTQIRRTRRFSADTKCQNIYGGSLKLVK